jgi:hypothetical protein
MPRGEGYASLPRGNSMTEPPGNLIASIRQRLLSRARAEHQDYQTLLIQYAAERFLYRLSQSGYRERFVLKGAHLFILWEGHLYRITRDIDLLGFGSNDVESVVRLVREICDTDVEADGLVFLGQTVTGRVIREGQGYEGVRARI